MKLIYTAAATFILMTTLCYGAEKAEIPAAPVKQEEQLVLKNENDKLSYAVGVDMARNFIKSKVQLDQTDLISGLKDVYSGTKLLLTENDLNVAMKTYRSSMNSGNYKILPGNVSYAIGVDMARKLKPLAVEFNLDALAVGLKDVFSAKKLLIDGNELRLILNAFQLELKQKRRRIQMKHSYSGWNLLPSNHQHHMQT
jgi:hypothetical protein